LTRVSLHHQTQSLPVKYSADTSRCSIAPVLPRPKPRRVVGPVSHDSEDNFNLRRVRERARAKSLASSQCLSPSPGPSMLTDEQSTTLTRNSADGHHANVMATEPAAISDDRYSSPAVPSSVAGEEEFPEIFTQIPNGDNMGYSGQDSQEEDEVRMDLDDSAFYRITYPNDQGGAHYSGIPPFPGSPSAADRITEIRNEETGQWEPLPPGYCAPRRADGDDREVLLASASYPAEDDDDDIARESSPSGSDYSSARKAKERDRAYRRSRGRPASDTEEEDDDDYHAFAQSLAQELSATHSKGHTLDRDSPTPRFTKEQKGKGREANNDVMNVNVDRDADGEESDMRHTLNRNSATPRFTKEQKGKGREANDDAMDVDADRDVDGGESDRRRKATRGISKEEKAEVEAFGQTVTERADELASKWNRQRRDILIRACLGTRLSRGPNSYNDFKSWYAEVHRDEKPIGSLSCYSNCLGVYPFLTLRNIDGHVE
jgi:hypothetical protein